MEINVDKGTKKTIANIYKDMLLHFSGLSATPANLSILGKKSNGSPMGSDGVALINMDKSIVQTLPNEYQMLVEQVLWISVRQLMVLNPGLLDDV